MKDVTAEEVKKSMMENGITEVDHHTCSICKDMTKYVRVEEKLFFNSSCDCTTEEFGDVVRPSNWESAAEYINLQLDPKIKEETARRFGIGMRTKAIPPALEPVEDATVYGSPKPDNQALTVKTLDKKDLLMYEIFASRLAQNVSNAWLSNQIADWQVRKIERKYARYLVAIDRGKRLGRLETRNG